MAIEKISIDIDSNSKEVQKELTKVNAQLKKIQKQLPSIQKSVEKLKKAEQSVKAINNQLKKLSTQKTKLQTDTSQLDYTAKKISNVTLQMNRLQARKVKLLVSIDQLLHAEAVLIRLNRELDLLNGRRAAIYIELGNIQDAIAGIDQLSAKLQQLGAMENISLPSIKGEISMNIQTKMNFDMSILTSKVEELKSLKDISVNIQAASKYVEEIEKNVPSNLDSMLSKLLAMGAAILGMGVLVGIAGAFVTMFPLAAIAGFVAIKALSTLLEDTAKSMERIDAKLPSDTKSMVSKLASMGIALLGMGALTALAGGLSAKFSKAAIAGFIAIKGLGTLLEDTADTMKVIDEKVPADLGSMVSKLASMGIALLGMGALTALAGGLANQFSDQASAGLEMIKDIIGLLGETAEAMEIINEKVPADLGSMVSKLASMGIAILGMGALVVIADGVATHFDGAKAGFEMIREITDLLGEAAIAMGEISSKISDDLGSMVSKLASMGIAILGMGALVVIAEVVAKKFDGGKAGLEMISGITDLLGNAADAMGKIDKKVSSDFESMIAKLANMGIAIVAMGALVVIAGAIVSKFKGAAAGLELINGIVDLLLKSAEALGKIDELVPSNIEKVAEKMGSIGVAIGGMSVLVGVVGALTSSGIGALIAGSGLLMVHQVAEELIHTSEAINQLDQNVPEDVSGVKTKIENIAKAIGYFTEANLGSVVDLFKNAVGTLNAAVAAEGIKKLLDIGLELKKFDDVTIPDNIQTKIQEIQAVFGYLKTGAGSIGDFIKTLTGNKIDTTTGGDAADAINSLASVAKSIEELEKIKIKEPTKIKEKIEALQSTFEYLGKTNGFFGDAWNMAFGGDIDDDKAKDAQNYIDSLAKIAENLQKIEGTTLNYGDVTTKLESIEKIIGELETIDISIDMEGTTLQEAVEKAGLLSELIGHLETALNFNFDEAAVGRFDITVDSIKSAIKKVMETDFTPRDANNKRMEMPDWTWEMENDIKQATDKLLTLNGLGTELSNALQFEFDDTSFGTFEDRVRLMQDTIAKVLMTDFSPKNEEGGNATFEAWNELSSSITTAVNKLTKLNEMGKQLETALDFNFDQAKVDNFGTTLDQIHSAVDSVNTMNFGTATGGTVNFSGKKQAGGEARFESSVEASDAYSANSDGAGVLDRIENARLKVEKINGLITTIQSVPKLDEGEFQTKIDAIEKCLEMIKLFVEKDENRLNAEAITSSATAFVELAKTLNDIVPEFQKFGDGFASGIMQKYNDTDPTTKINGEFTQLVTDLKGKITDFEGIGVSYRDGLMKGMIETIQSIPTEFSNVISTLELGESGSIKARLMSVGTTLGETLVKGFSAGISKLSDAVELAMTNAENAATGKEIIREDGSGNQYINGPGGKVQEVALGGIVPGSQPLGGLSGMFRKKGTDTVPAILTPGEFVQRRAAVGRFGVDFMKRVNGLDVQGAFRAMTSRFGIQGLTPAVSTVVNNINHTTNNANRVTQHVSGGNADYIMKRAGRYLR